MKKFLIAIRPQWVEKICHKIGEDETGKAIYEKRIEVRKSAPKEVPFKCYIYETKGQYVKFTHGAHTKYGYGRGKVIGEFICDKVEDFYCASVPYQRENNLGYGRFIDNGVYKVKGWHEGIVFERNDRYIDTMLNNNDLKEMCLSAQELFDYIGVGKHLYAWHISDLKIYDEPKELSEFRKPCKINLPICDRCEYYSTWSGRCENITRPPQSWQYIEDLGEEE